MDRHAGILLFVAAAVLAPAPPAAAKPARFANARLETRPAAGGLEKTLSALAAGRDAPAWVAWPVPGVGHSHHMCCYGSMDDLSSSPYSGRCFLEEELRTASLVHSSGKDDCVDRSGSVELLVLVRLEGRQAGRLRRFRPTARSTPAGCRSSG
jgi:hypothetical protein